MTVPSDREYSTVEMIRFNILETKNEMTKIRCFNLLLEKKKSLLTDKKEAKLLYNQIKQNEAALKMGEEDLGFYEKVLVEQIEATKENQA